MKNTIIKKRLSEITRIIISAEINYMELKNALDDYKSLLFEISGLGNDPENREDIHLDSGKAIGPEWAAICIDDLMRTKRFICGVHKAVQHLKQTKKDEMVHILYCGTGPFATLVLPLLTLYEPNEVQLVLLEVNPISIKSLKNCIAELNVGNYISGIYQGDGSIFKVPSASDIDILLVECLQHALNHEPQVAITYNLLPQLREDVILIPEEINLHVSLSNSKLKAQNLEYREGAEHLAFYKHYDLVFTLNKADVLKRIHALNENALDFSESQTLFSKEDKVDYDEISIATEIKTFADEKLSMNESGLTIPKILGYFNNDKSIKGINTQYMANDHPELKTTFIR